MDGVEPSGKDMYIKQADRYDSLLVDGEALDGPKVTAGGAEERAQLPFKV